MNLNTSEWKEFKVSRTNKQPGLLEIEQCRCGCAGDLDDGDDICYIGAKKSDNGVMKRVKRDNALVSVGNGIMIICDGQGSVGYSNYMKDDFIGSTTTSIGYDEEINWIRAMFIVTCLDMNRYKYSYGRKYRPSMNDASIKLPIQYNSDGSPLLDNTYKYSEQGYVPDWQFMEDYIKSLHYKPLTTKRVNEKKMELNVSQWEEFDISKLFIAQTGNTDITQELLTDDGLPVVSAGVADTGIIGKTSVEARVFNKNTITVDMFGYACARPYQYKMVTHARCFSLSVVEYTLTTNQCLFLSQILNYSSFKYAYGRMCSWERIKNDTLKLPIQRNANGNPVIDEEKKYNNKGYIPDWQFMEDYINSLPYSDRIV